MRATTELLTDVVNVRADIKAFAANDVEVDFWKRDAINAVAVDMDQTWLALDDSSLPRQFIKGNASVFFRRHHRGHLIEIASEFFERSTNRGFIERRHLALVHDFALSILRAGRDAECKGASIFLIFAHEQILDLCSASNRQEKQTRCNGVEGSTMTHFFYLELPTDHRDDVMRSHPFGLVHEQDAIKSGT